MFLGSRVQLVGIWDVQARRHNKCDAGLKHQQVGIEWCLCESMLCTYLHFRSEHHTC
jgi:hypothetical protein